MTQGFEQQHTTFGPVLRTAPAPQTVGAKLPPAEQVEDRPAEPRSFQRPEVRP